MDQFMLSFASGQTALHVAQISRDTVLAEFLKSKGADRQIQPVNFELIKEYECLGESWS
jgi:hypothetical protein